MACPTRRRRTGRSCRCRRHATISSAITSCRRLPRSRAICRERRKCWAWNARISTKSFAPSGSLHAVGPELVLQYLRGGEAFELKKVLRRLRQGGRGHQADDFAFEHAD